MNNSEACCCTIWGKLTQWNSLLHAFVGNLNSSKKNNYNKIN